MKSLSHLPIEHKTTDVLICGGGISGLTLAVCLKHYGLKVALLDRNKQPGGVIGSKWSNGFLFERGPNTVLDKYESFDQLIKLAGLENELVHTPLKGQQRHIFTQEKMLRVPTDPIAFLKSPLLCTSQKLSLFMEPFRARGPLDESIGDFVRHRLGDQWLQNLIGPLVSGVWAGNPETLNIHYAFPIMKAMEIEHGSLIKAAAHRILSASKTRRESKKNGIPFTKRMKRLISFRNGLETLPRQLAQILGDAYYPSTKILEVHPIGTEQEGWSITAHNEQTQISWNTKQLVIAAEAPEAAKWVEGFDAQLANTLQAIPYNTLCVAGLGVEKNDVPGAPQGFGFLVPRSAETEAVRILGAIINSNFHQGRAPEGCLAMTLFIGGSLDPEAIKLDEDQLETLLKNDLAKTIGWNGHRHTLFIERWERAIPQYDMSHGKRLKVIESAEASHKGLFLMGNWRGGVSVADRIEVATTIAGQILKLHQTI